MNDLPLFRTSDPVTSRQGAAHVRLRVNGHQHRLLTVYGHPSAVNGLTDEEAGTLSGLAQLPRCCYWKRCSELRALGLIEATPETRTSSIGTQMMVSVITAEGHNALGRARMDAARAAQ